jgi:parallel beta-helix repeat protein
MTAGTNRIITLLIVAFVLVTIAPTFTGKVIYVDDDGPADFNNIQAAIDDAILGDTVIVADGIYTGPGNRDIYIHNKSITIRSENGPENCIIDCNGTEAEPHRGFNFINGEEANSILDGFTITNGYAEYGGGIYCEGSKPTIMNCTITGNTASYYGGGMFNFNSSPTLKNCTFSENSAIREGGGVLNVESNPTLTNCTFSGNSAERGGGGMYNDESDPMLINCTFSRNSADFGGGMLNINSSPTMTNCTLNMNSASRDGGGMCNIYSRPTLTNCTFSRNSAAFGGGMLNFESSPTLTNCTFSGNSAGRDGGGMLNIHSRPTLTNCVFTDNSAIGSGMWGGRGGGVCNIASSPTLTNCTFSGNSAVGSDWYYGYGGGMGNYSSNLTLTNCIFAANAALSGNALSFNSDQFHGPSNVQITNCIFWDGGEEIWNNDGSTIAIKYSDMEGGWPGEGNIDADPCFVDLGYWDSNDTQDPRDDVWIEGDYHLLPDSPCINAGDPNYIAEINERDLDSKPRVIGCRIDMGAFEYRHLVPAEVRIVPRTINLANKGKWITALLWLPENYNVAEIDFCILLLEDEIEPEQLFINKQEQVLTAIFSREEVQAILNIGDVELTVNAQLTDATYFEGTDVIKVMREGGGKLAKLVQASNPNPADGATNVSTNADLGWTAGPYATSHNVYFGTSSEPPFVCNQTAATFDPGTMFTLEQAVNRHSYVTRPLQHLTPAQWIMKQLTIGISMRSVSGA